MIDSRDETKAGAHISEMVELGIERQKFSARVFQALIKELEIHQKVLAFNSPQTFTHKKHAELK